MSFNQKSNDTISGYVTNVSNENKKTKFFIKFTLLSKNETIVDCWVFSNNTGILSSPLGMALSESMKNKTGIKLYGKLEHNEGLATKTFKMQVWNKYEKVNLNYELEPNINDIISIKDALLSGGLNTIEVFVIDIHPSEYYIKEGITKTLTFVLVADETATTYLTIDNIQPDLLKTEKTYLITKTRKKNFNNSFILSCTVDTSISLSTSTINPNIDDIATTMSISLIDEKYITTTILEIGKIQRSSTCLTCLGSLQEVENVPSLMICTKCQRHTLKRNVTENCSTTITLKKNEEIINLYVNQEIFKKLIEITGIENTLTDTELIIALMSYNELTYTYSQLRKEITDIKKP